MARANYLVEVDGKKALRDIKGMTKHIRDIQERVEKSTDSYKKCMEEVWLIRKYKGNRESGLSFSDFMYAETGMSKAMCYRLCQLWEQRLKIEEYCANGLSYNDSCISFVLSAYDSLSMKSMLNDMKYDTMIQTINEMDANILDGQITRDELLDHYYAIEAEKDNEFLLQKKEAATIETQAKEVEQILAVRNEESTAVDTRDPEEVLYTARTVEELADIWTAIEDAINNGVIMKFIITTK